MSHRQWRANGRSLREGSEPSWRLACLKSGAGCAGRRKEWAQARGIAFKGAFKGAVAG